MDKPPEKLQGYADWNNPTVEEIRQHYKQNDYHCGAGVLPAGQAIEVLLAKYSKLEQKRDELIEQFHSAMKRGQKAERERDALKQEIADKHSNVLHSLENTRRGSYDA